MFEQLLNVKHVRVRVYVKKIVCQWLSSVSTHWTKMFGKLNHAKNRQLMHWLSSGINYGQKFVLIFFSLDFSHFGRNIKFEVHIYKLLHYIIHLFLNEHEQLTFDISMAVLQIVQIQWLLIRKNGIGSFYDWSKVIRMWKKNLLEANREYFALILLNFCPLVL